MLPSSLLPCLLGLLIIPEGQRHNDLYFKLLLLSFIMQTAEVQTVFNALAANIGMVPVLLLKVIVPEVVMLLLWYF